MHIDEGKCVGCANCVPVCPMGAIYIGDNRRAAINDDECVECHNCYRGLSTEHLPASIVRAIRTLLRFARLRFEPDPDVCPTSAVVPDELAWPRTLRRVFSDPLATHDLTGTAGRGTAEVKTNDLTGRVQEGEGGFVVELGRPGVGVRLHDVNRMTTALAAAGVRFEPNNPVAALLADVDSGQIRPDVLDEKILSCIVEFKVRLERVREILGVVESTSADIGTVVGVGVSARYTQSGSDPLKPILFSLGYDFYRGKVNLGLGRPSNPDIVPAESWQREALK